VDLAGISCASNSYCAAVGRRTLISTENGGKTWSSKHVPKGIEDLAAVSCVSEAVCTAVGDDEQVGGAVVGS
jgi:photosystem II stability/assembly factor-like uncharacterized protein